VHNRSNMKEDIKAFLLEHKNTATLLALTLMIVILPLALVILRQQQIFFSRASGELIKIGTGRCIQEVNGKKVAICNEIPLIMAAPYDPNVATATATPAATVRPSSSATPAATINPSASASASPAAQLNIKNRIVGFMSKVSDAIVKEAKAQEIQNVCGAAGNVAGQGGFWDAQLNKCGEILNWTEINNSCSATVQIRFRSPKWDAVKKEWYTEKQDGTILTQSQIIADNNDDYRVPGMDWIRWTGDSPYINCNIFFRFSGRTDCAATIPKNAAGESIGRENTELDPGGEITFTVSRDKATANNDQPGCRHQVRTKVRSTNVSPSPVSTSPSPSPQCTAGLYGAAYMEIPNGCGTFSGAQINSGSTAGVITYTAPNITSDAVCTMKVNTTNNGDCKLDSGTKGTVNNPLKPNETMNVNFTNACTDNVPGCTLPIVISGAAAISTDKVSYKLAESESGLATATERGYSTPNFTTTYALVDQKPGLKTIYVEYKDKRTGQKKTDFTTIELIEQKPVIKQVGCSLDTTNSKVIFDIQGVRFGTEGTKVSIAGTSLEITQQSDTAIKAAYLTPLTTGQQTYKVMVTRKDNLVSEEVDCKLGIAQISLGARLYCRGQGKFNLSNVKLTILDAQGKKTEETTNISNDGLISGLKTKFEIGKNYTITIDAPTVLKRNISFTAKEGTTVITKDDGTTLILPVGDIYPITDGGDGVINTLDQAELKRQWRNVESTNTANLTADFNQDKRVNAFDWSCMRKDFGASDDGAATTPSSSQTTTVEFNNPSSDSGSNQGLTINFGVPSPNPNVVPVPGSSIDDTTGVENEEPRRFIQGTQ